MEYFFINNEHESSIFFAIGSLGFGGIFHVHPEKSHAHPSNDETFAVAKVRQHSTPPVSVAQKWLTLDKNLPGAV